MRGHIIWLQREVRKINLQLSADTLFCLELCISSQVNHIYICDYHKNMIQSARMKRKRRDSEDGDGSPDGDEDVPEVCKQVQRL